MKNSFLILHFVTFYFIFDFLLASPLSHTFYEREYMFASDFWEDKKELSVFWERSHLSCKFWINLFSITPDSSGCRPASECDSARGLDMSLAFDSGVLEMGYLQNSSSPGLDLYLISEPLNWSSDYMFGCLLQSLKRFLSEFSFINLSISSDWLHCNCWKNVSPQPDYMSYCGHALFTLMFGK